MSPSLTRKITRRVPLALAAISVLAVAAAVASQQWFDMRPCPWCILQRIIFLAIAVLCLLTAFVPSRRMRIGLNLATFAFAVSGVVAATYQHVVAAKLFSCNLTFADRVITALGVELVWPLLFQVTATCAEAAVTVLGVPFEFYSLTLFALIALVAMALALHSVRVRTG